MLKKTSTESKPSAEGVTVGEEEDPMMIGKQQTYYVEENEKFLNLLISNCEPILG